MCSGDAVHTSYTVILGSHPSAVCVSKLQDKSHSGALPVVAMPRHRLVLVECGTRKEYGDLTWESKKSLREADTPQSWTRALGSRTSLDELALVYQRDGKRMQLWGLTETFVNNKFSSRL